MKKSFFLFVIVLFLSSAAFSQTTQRLKFSKGRGESGPLIASKASGTVLNQTYKDFTFSIPVGRGAEIEVETLTGEPVKFEVISPKKKTLFKDESEIMDELPDAGKYTIRVYRTKDSADGKSSFRLSIWMYI